MAFCSGCGAQVPENSGFCPQCGRTAGSTGGGAAVAAAPAPEAAPSSGLSESAASGLAYVTIIPAILFLVMAPYNQNRNIKFHCFQSLGLAVLWFACSVVMVIPILGWIAGILGAMVVFVFWLISIIKAFGGGRFKVPVIGGFAEKQANS